MPRGGAVHDSITASVKAWGSAKLKLRGVDTAELRPGKNPIPAYRKGVNNLIRQPVVDRRPAQPVVGRENHPGICSREEITPAYRQGVNKRIRQPVVDCRPALPVI